MRLWGTLFLLGLLAVACSSHGGSGGVTSCTPGASLACACDDGRPSTQTCDASGAPGACRCGLDGGGGPVDVVASDAPAAEVAAFDAAGDAAGCAAGQSRCAGVCVDTRASGANCGACGRACAEGEGCQDGACRPSSSDCRTAPCPLRTYCDLSTGACRPGCTGDEQCGPGEVCDVTARTCGCAAGTHACGGACASNTAVATCGASCAACATADHGAATCDGAACGIACDAGYHLCGGACVSNASVATCGASCSACPTDPAGTATCDGTSCGLTCNAGRHACGGACVSNTSVATCGTSCTPCPSTGGTASCDGAQCGLACPSGTHACAGGCSSNTSVMTCGAGCTPCATSPNGTTSCEDSHCRLICQDGYVRCVAGCCPRVAPVVLATATIATANRPALSVDATDRLHLFYGTGSTGSATAYYATTAGGAPWATEYATGAASGGWRVTGRVDAMGRPVVCLGGNRSTGTPAWTLQCSRKTGTAWAVVGTQSNATEAIDELSMAASPDGNFAVLVNETYRGTSGSPGIRMAQWNGAAFELSTLSGVQDSTNLPIAFEAGGNPLVAWWLSDASGRCLQISRRAGGVWTNSPISPFCAAGVLPAMAVGPDGDVHVVSTTASDFALTGGVSYAHRTGTSWTYDDRLAYPGSTTVQDIAVTTGPGGTVHAVWVVRDFGGSGNPDLNYAMRIDGTWVGINYFVYGATRPTIAVDSHGGVHIVYVNNSTSQLTYIHW